MALEPERVGQFRSWSPGPWQVSS